MNSGRIREKEALAWVKFKSLFKGGGDVDELWSRVVKYLWLLRFCPFLEMVAVGNNLAFGKVSKDSDIDLFIVAKKGRLFFVRILLTIYFQLRGVRRYGNKKNGRFCLSFYVVDDALNLEGIALGAADIYLYFWIKKLVPIVGEQCYWRFLEANVWVDGLFEDEKPLLLEKEQRKNCARLLKVGKFVLLGKRSAEVVLNVLIIWWLEPILKRWQKKRALEKMNFLRQKEPNVVISDQMLKFHDRDAREEINANWG